MEKKLTIEHLSAYFPYGLKVTFKGEEEIKYDLVGIVLGTDPLQVISEDGYFGHGQIEGCFPILKPMFWLTKEFDTKEHGRCRAIDYISVSNKDEKAILMIVTKGIPVINRLEYWKVSRLLELHFDVFGLIDAGLAIEEGGQG